MNFGRRCVFAVALASTPFVGACSDEGPRGAERIAFQTAPMTDIQVNSTYVCWNGDRGQIYKAGGLSGVYCKNKDGTGSTITIAEFSSEFMSFTIDEDSVYWSRCFDELTQSDGWVERCPIETYRFSDGNRQTLAVLGEGASAEMAINDRFVFSGIYDVGIARIEKSSGTQLMIVDEWAPGFLRWSKQRLFWRDSAGGISSAKEDGSDLRKIVTQAGSETTVAADDRYIYWGIPTLRLEDGSELHKTEIETSVDQVLVKPVFVPFWIQTDGVTVYWGDKLNGTLRSVPAAGGEPSIIDEPNDDDPNSRFLLNPIFIDDTHIYWTRIAGGYPLGVGAIYRKRR
jgi:hypothetical protein